MRLILALLSLVAAASPLSSQLEESMNTCLARVSASGNRPKNVTVLETAHTFLSLCERAIEVSARNVVDIVSKDEKLELAQKEQLYLLYKADLRAAGLSLAVRYALSDAKQ